MSSVTPDCLLAHPLGHHRVFVCILVTLAMSNVTWVTTELTPWPKALEFRFSWPLEAVRRLRSRVRVHQAGGEGVWIPWWKRRTRIIFQILFRILPELSRGKLKCFSQNFGKHFLFPVMSRINVGLRISLFEQNMSSKPSHFWCRQFGARDWRLTNARFSGKKEEWTNCEHDSSWRGARRWRWPHPEGEEWVGEAETMWTLFSKMLLPSISDIELRLFGFTWFALGDWQTC